MVLAYQERIEQRRLNSSSRPRRIGLPLLIARTRRLLVIWLSNCGTARRSKRSNEGAPVLQHPYDLGYARGVRSAAGANRAWIEAHLQAWLAYPTDSAGALERRMGLIDALADLLDGRPPL